MNTFISKWFFLGMFLLFAMPQISEAKRQQTLCADFMKTLVSQQSSGDYYGLPSKAHPIVSKWRMSLIEIGKRPSTVLDDRFKLVTELFRRGINESDTSIVAVHGGPLESVLSLIRTGMWPAGAVFRRDVLEGTEAMRPTLSFFTIAENILTDPDLSKVTRLTDHNAAKSFKDAVGSADAINAISSESAGILTLLGLPINRSSMSAIAHVCVESFSAPELLDYLKTKKLKLQTVLAALKIVKDAGIGGVVIGIDRNAFLNGAKLSKAPGGGVALEFPDGLPIEWIQGLDAFGDLEYKFLENIGDNFGYKL